MRHALLAALCLAVPAVCGMALPFVAAAQSAAAYLPVGTIGQWPMDEGAGSTLQDISGLGNNAAITGSPAWAAGVHGLALALSGTGQYAVVPANPTLDVTNAVTLAMWIKPDRHRVQDLLKKAFTNSVDGYELAMTGPSSSWPQRVYVRFNQRTAGDAYRVNSTSLYPYDGSTWLHVAATYDGSQIKLYVNGLQEGPALAMLVPISTNGHPLTIGAQTDGSRAFAGMMDDARLYDRSLDATEIEALASHTIASSAGSGGTIDPIGDVLVRHTASKTFTITPDDCHTIGDVLVDGLSVGPVPSYTFDDVFADHTIVAVFTVKTYTIAATAGAGGSISPSGSVVVDCGSDQSFDVIPESAHFRILDLLVDGSSVGAVPSYTFPDVVNDHTIEASFAVVLDEITPMPPPGVVISPMNPCVAVPVYFQRPTDTPIRGYSVTIELSPDISLCGAEVVTAGYTIAPRSFLVTPLSGNRWTIDEVTLGYPCGVTGSSTIFTLYLTAASHTCGTATITVVGALARDCMNHPVVALAGPPATIEYDMCGPAATGDLAAVQVKSGNYVPPPDSHGTTGIRLTYSLPPDAVGAEIYRKGFGGYPQYDENGGAPPSPPTYPPDPSWTLVTDVTASGQTDDPGARDFWYYVLFSKDQYGNASPVSNRTGGTLDYHLGDVSDGYTQGQGDALVTTADISLLGIFYGFVPPINHFAETVDVGPTADTSPDGRPLTDNRIQFEDLVIFSINYGEVSKRIAKPAPADADELTVKAPAAVREGETVDAVVLMRGTGLVQALSMGLDWDPEIVEPIGFVAGELLDQNSGVAFSARLGSVDAAVLGASVGGIMGEGEMTVVQFRAVASGSPRIVVGSVDARDAKNRPVRLELTSADATGLPAATLLLPPAPNPFGTQTLLRFRLALRTDTELAIYAVDGRLVRMLDFGAKDPGEYEIAWDGRDRRGQSVASGQYFVRLRAAGFVQTRPLTILR